MTDKPKIEFPCTYPIKVIGKNADNLDAEIIAAINPLLDKPFEGKIKQRPSKENNFISYTLEIDVKSEAQIKEIFQALKSNEHVIMVI